MAIQPIDLQTIFSQIDKIGKTQAFAQHGASVQSALEQEESTRRLKEKHEGVEESPNAAEDGATHIKERKNSQEQEKEEHRHKKKDEEVPLEPRIQVVSDPTLGRHIDVSG